MIRPHSSPKREANRIYIRPMTEPDDLAEVLNPENWGSAYFAVDDEQGELIGFFCFQADGDTVEFGLGLRPDWTGRGRGLAFLETGLRFARERYRPAAFRLAVAQFNQRAIRLYTKAGFQTVRTYLHPTNGGEFPFAEMVRPA